MNGGLLSSGDQLQSMSCTFAEGGCGRRPSKSSDSIVGLCKERDCELHFPREALIPLATNYFLASKERFSDETDGRPMTPLELLAEW